MRDARLVRRPRIGLVGGEVGIAVAFLVASALGALRDQPFDLPTRLAASLVAGASALLRPDGATIALGVLVLVVLGALAGGLFAFLCGWFPGLAETPGTLLIAGATYAAFLWWIGFYLLGFLVWPWLTRTDPVVYSLAAIGGGGSLGAIFALAGVHRPSQLE